MRTLYGDYSKEQFEKYREKLHSKIHWLILYKDPETCDKFGYVDFDKYFYSLMCEINALNEIILDDPYVIELMTILQAGYDEIQKGGYEYKNYRKFILDAHSVLDKVCCEEV